MKQFPDVIVENEPLSDHTTIRIGGPADLFCEINTIDCLLPVLQESLKLNIPVVLIGGGSNILADDRGYRGLVIKFMNQDPPLLEFPLLTVSAGVSLKDILEYAAEHSLSGLEFLAGIPGSIGGAVYMNAGAYGKNISDVMHSAVIINENYTTEAVDTGFFRFSYRTSILQETPHTVASVTLKVSRGEKELIQKEYDRIIGIREEKHPGPDLPCAGSYFKNLPPENPGEHRRPAGYFLEKAGAKTMSCGRAAVYKDHANIIVNAGGATAADVLLLAEQMKKAVAESFQITLREEVRFLDADHGFSPACSPTEG